MDTSSAASDRLEIPSRVIKPPHGWAAFRLGELWEYRELLYFLTWRDIKVRYKQAVLGVAWAVLQPVLTMVVFTVVFNHFLKVKSSTVVTSSIMVNGHRVSHSHVVPYTLFSYAALLPWGLFSSALTRAGTSLVGNANLLTKVYFPRLVIPMSAVLGGVLDFVISFIVFVALMYGYGYGLGVNTLWLVPLAVLAMAVALAFGLWLSALNVLYRDVQYVIPFLIQLWMFISPVAYVVKLHGYANIIYGLNPLTGVIEGFRWALLGGTPPGRMFALSCGIVAFLLVTGLIYFKRMERTFADVV